METRYIHRILHSAFFWVDNLMKKFIKSLILRILFISFTLVTITNSAFCLGTEQESLNQDKKQNKLWALNAELSFNALDVQIERKFLLFDSNNILFKDSHIAVGYNLHTLISQIGNGVYLRVSPIAIFDVTFSYNFIYEWFGMRFPDVNKVLGGNEPTDRISDGYYENATGHKLQITPMLKMKFGPVILVNVLSFYYINMSLNTAYFNWHYEHLMNDGWNYFFSISLGFELTEKCLLGFGNTMIKVMDADYTRYNFSIMFMYRDFKGISKKDSLMLAVHYTYKSKFKLDDFITGVNGLVIDLTYSISFEW